MNWIENNKLLVSLLWPVALERLENITKTLLSSSIAVLCRMITT